MTERPMKFWKVDKLANEFGLSRIAVGRLLKALGARRWTNSGGSHSTVWYWEDDGK